MAGPAERHNGGGRHFFGAGDLAGPRRRSGRLSIRTRSTPLMSRVVPWSVVVVALLMLPALPVGLGATVTGLEAVRAPHPASAASTVGSAFASISNFEDLRMDGWTTVHGTAAVSTSVEYEG